MGLNDEGVGRWGVSQKKKNLMGLFVSVTSSVPRTSGKCTYALRGTYSDRLTV